MVAVAVVVVVVVGLSTAKWTGIDHCAETDAVCRLVGLSTAKWVAWPVAMIGSVDSLGMLHFKLYTLYIVSSLCPLYTGLIMT